MNWLTFAVFAAAGLASTIAIVIVAGLLVFRDASGYFATGSEALGPAGAPVGRALVVYSPGISGAAKAAAKTIAANLQSRGYAVSCAGVRSRAAADASGYGVIIMGGPMYLGRASRSIQAYMAALKPDRDAKIGAFATTGSQQHNARDIASFGQQAAGVIASTAKEAIATRTIRLGADGTTDCLELVSAVLR